ncbi:MAG: hypothetical protein ACTSWQ_02060 [Candidatus Thorarchaeota archaeon]
MNWKEEEKKIDEAVQQLKEGFSSLVLENQKLRKMNAEMYKHAAADMQVEQLRKLNKELFALAGMPSEVGFAKKTYTSTSMMKRVK